MRECAPSVDGLSNRFAKLAIVVLLPWITAFFSYCALLGLAQLGTCPTGTEGTFRTVYTASGSDETADDSSDESSDEEDLMEWGQIIDSAKEEEYARSFITFGSTSGAREGGGRVRERLVFETRILRKSPVRSRLCRRRCWQSHAITYVRFHPYNRNIIRRKD